MVRIRFDEDQDAFDYSLDAPGVEETRNLDATPQVQAQPANEDNNDNEEDASPESVSLHAAKEEAQRKKKAQQASIQTLTAGERKRRREQQEQRAKERKASKNKSKTAKTPLAPLPDTVLEQWEQSAHVSEEESAPASRALHHRRTTFDSDQEEEEDEELLVEEDAPETRVLLDGRLQVVALSGAKRMASRAVGAQIRAFQLRHFYGDRVKRTTDGTRTWMPQTSRNRRTLPIRFATKAAVR